jgi:hypothetical protein
MNFVYGDFPSGIPGRFLSPYNFFLLKFWEAFPMPRGFLLFFALLLCLPLLFLERGLTAFELVPKTPDVKGTGSELKGGGDDLHYYKFGPKYGFINKEGAMVINPSYNGVDNFTEFGLAKVLTGTGMGVVDSKDNFLVKPILSDVQILNLEDRLVLLGKNYDWWGKISPTGEWVIKPRFHKLTNLGHGFFRAEYQGKSALFDNKGELLTDIAYDSLKNLSKMPDGSFLLTFGQGGKEGIMDGKGKVVISPRFDSISPGFDENGKFIMRVGDNMGVLDISDKWVIEPNFHYISYDKEGKVFWVMETKFTDSYYYYSLDGKKIGPIPPDKIWSELKGYPFELANCFPTKDDKKFGYCNAQGKMVINAVYDMAWLFSPVGLARVLLKDKFGFVDPKGKVAVPIEYEDAKDFYPGGAAPVKKGGLWGLLNTKGAFIIKPSMDEAPEEAFENAYFIKIDGKYGLINSEGVILRETDLEDHKAYRESGYAWVKKGDLWGLMDKTGKFFLEPTYQEVGDYSDNHMAPAFFQDKFAVIDELGVKLAHTASECGREVVKDKKGNVTYPKDFSCANAGGAA